MDTNATKNPSVDQGESIRVVTFPNGSCVPSEELAMTLTDYVDADALIKRRHLLRIPMWICSACALYMAVMLLVSEKRKSEKLQREEYAAKLKVGRLITTCFTALSLTYFSAAIFIEVSGMAYCNSIYTAENALYWLNIAGIYGVLWLRQRVIYSQHTLREAVSNVTSFLSYATVVMVVVLPIMNSALFASGMEFCFEEDVYICRIVVNRETAYYTALLVSHISVPVLVPLTLLVLFAWPLIQYHLSSNKQAKGQRSVIKVLNRIVVATFICLLSDVGAMICNDTCEVFLSPTFRQISLFCNIACLVASFADWRCVLFPMFGQPTQPKSDSSNPTPASAGSAV